MRIDFAHRTEYLSAPIERESVTSDVDKSIPLVDEIVLTDQRYRKQWRIIQGSSRQYQAIFWRRVGSK